jgi:hypothetical protein
MTSRAKRPEEKIREQINKLLTTIEDATVTELEVAFSRPETCKAMRQIWKYTKILVIMKGE